MNFTADGRFANIAYYSTVHDKYYYEGSADIKLDFDATASATTDIGGKVSLTGSGLTEGEFSFLLNSADSKFAVDSSKKPIKAVNAADGTFVFKDVTFEKEGTYYFVISADASVDVKNVNIDESVYHVTVKVIKDRNGICKVSDTLITKNGSTEAQDKIEFANVYEESSSVVFWIGIAACAISVVGAVVVLVSRIKRKRAKNSN
jgi:pilin isopeptide linkage protein